ncbi:MAG: ATP-dependent 6-phosphofructokinase [Deltaproteobacteria bacterium]|nr:MAG: ATP-dependent 6-phosphofructokinase [Deltaproteobacteria bacterium]
MAVAVLTSGGDAPGMNAAVRAVVKFCAREGLEVHGVRNGYEGLIDGFFEPLHPRDVDPIGSYGGTVLGSARSKRFMTPEGRAAAARQLADHDGLVVIGGNGSLTGAHALHLEHGVKVVGLPASIDNDLGCTSLAIGVDTALNTIVEACDRISDTARAHRRVFVVEVMGRQCGYLAMASAVAAGADACLYRERGKDEDTLVAELGAVIDRGFAPERGKQRVLILKAEGVEVPTDRLVRRLQPLADAVQADVRGTVLGHLVRGGSPSYQDRMIAGRLSVAALTALTEGKSDVMVGWQPWVPGEATADPSCQLFPLATMLEHTASLLDGSSPVTRRRVRMMEQFEGVLAV